MLKVAIVIGSNDVGGAEFVAYQHTLMVHRNSIELVVLSGGTGKFYELIKAAGIDIKIIGMQPTIEVVEPLLCDCGVVFNCNFLELTPIVIKLKQKRKFRYLTIVHTDINVMYDLLVRYDEYIDGYCAIHQKMVDLFSSRNIIERRKFTIIPNCVNVELISSFSNCRSIVREHFGFDTSDFVIGMISRMAPNKNILGALQILSQLPEQMNAKLLIVGGTEFDSAESLSYYLSVLLSTMSIERGRTESKVIVTGNMTSSDVYRFMTAFDLGLNCSPSEGLPVSLLEMMCAGIPCVMPGIGDIPDVLANRGVVIPLRQRFDIHEIVAVPCYKQSEVQLFVNEIISLHSQPEKMKEMGKVSMEYIKGHRNLKHQETRFIEFLTSN